MGVGIRQTQMSEDVAATALDVGGTGVTGIIGHQRLLVVAFGARNQIEFPRRVDTATAVRHHIGLGNLPVFAIPDG